MALCPVLPFERGFLAFWKDRKLDQPRLWRGRQHGYGCSRRSRLDVLHQGEHQSIGEVWRQLKLLLQDFLFAVVVFVVDGDLPVEASILSLGCFMY